MSAGHLPTAVSAASTHAARLDREVLSRTPEFLSVYGALLLRGAIAAAHHHQRATACELLGEAEDAARRLGHDANLRWTAFGTATITVTERKASLLIDAARAFLQWGRQEQA